MSLIGHWATLDEAQKLTQSQLIPGVIEEDIKRENILYRLPVAQARGLSIKWNREKTTNEGNVSTLNVGDQISWTGGIEYDPQETFLKTVALQQKLDNFVTEIYGTINDYRAQTLVEMKKGMVRRLGDLIIYGDTTYSTGNKEPDGLHALAAVQAGTSLDIDQNGPLSIANWRVLNNAMKYGVDLWLTSNEIGMRIDEAYEEAGFARLATGTAGTMVGFTKGLNQIGEPIMFFAGKPIIRSDFMMLETDGTGHGSDARAKSATGTTYSIFGIKLGDVFNKEPGLCYAFGNTKAAGDLYAITLFPELEDYIAEGIRLVNYSNLLLGSKLCLGRISDITDANIVF
jgi:hypothetical protein